MTGIVAFAFGVPETILSNRRISEIASTKARTLQAPVYTQRDVQLEPGVIQYYTEEDPGSPPPTLRIARGAVRWAIGLKFSRLYVVAAKPHLWRAVRDLEQAVREAKAQIEILACEEIEQYPEDSWFCSDSTQDRIRSREAWEKRENVLKLMPFFVYKRVAA